jgi:Glycoside-hydrolase family GH114
MIVAAVVCNAALAAGSGHARAHTTAVSYKRLPHGNDSWFWEIDPPKAGLAGLPAIRAAYPKPGSAKIWDTDLFADSNTSHGSKLGIPTGKSPVVTALHAAGHYSICYVEVGAFQTGYPDNSDFARADYGNRSRRYQMQGYPNEWYFDIRGFRNYVAGNSSTLTGAAKNIAAGLGKRFAWCKLEGQDAVEPDDVDGYTNRSASGAHGVGWGLTKADAAGFERWLAYTAHHNGLAVLQKNDPGNAKADEHLFDGVLSESCNQYHDPCAGNNGDWNGYLKLGKPVLNAEYMQGGETTAKFCSSDRGYGIWGALFGLNLSGPKPYQVCWNSKHQL